MDFEIPHAWRNFTRHIFNKQHCNKEQPGNQTTLVFYLLSWHKVCTEEHLMGLAVLTNSGCCWCVTFRCSDLLQSIYLLPQHFGRLSLVEFGITLRKLTETDVLQCFPEQKLHWPCDQVTNLTHKTLPDPHRQTALLSFTSRCGWLILSNCSNVQLAREQE